MEHNLGDKGFGVPKEKEPTKGTQPHRIGSIEVLFTCSVRLKNSKFSNPFYEQIDDVVSSLIVIEFILSSNIDSVL